MYEDFRQFRNPERLLQRFGIEEPRHIDLEALAYYCGARIKRQPLHGCAARILGNGTNAIITVETDTTWPRYRFSVAHELGHWMFDRGTVGLTCTARQFASEWGHESPERRANRFAAGLLLPRYLFEPASAGRPIVFETLNELSDLFMTSLTATAIRLVNLGSFPSMVICHSKERGREWFDRHPDVPKSIWPFRRTRPGTVAHAILQEDGSADRAYVPADVWIDHPDALRYVIHEESVPIGRSMVLSLLWWEDQAQIIDLS